MFIQWWYTLPETNSLSLKINGWFRWIFLLGLTKPIFRGELWASKDGNFSHTPEMKRNIIFQTPILGFKMLVLRGCMMKIPMFHRDEGPSWGRFSEKRRNFWGSQLPRIGWFVGVLMSWGKPKGDEEDDVLRKLGVGKRWKHSSPNHPFLGAIC